MPGEALDPLSSGYVRLCVAAALLGVPLAVAGAVFVSLTERAREGLWSDLPEALGFDAPPWWYVLLLPLVGALIVFAAIRLPGHGGHSPVQGLSMDVGPLTTLPGVLLAAAATLAFGMVLGPEAPLIAIGLAMGAALGRLAGVPPGAVKVLALAGAFGALSTVLGGPLVASLVLLEVIVVAGLMPATMIIPAVVPGFVAAAAGALAFTGVGDWPGLGHPALVPPPLEAYPEVRIADIAWCIPLALVIGVAIGLARPLAVRVAARAERRPAAVLLGSALAIGLLAVAFRWTTDRPVDLVLFSGQTAMPALVAEGSAVVLLLVVLVKGLAYVLSLGAGFRGGPIFPACAIGVAAGSSAAIVLPGLDSAPAIVCGLAAGAAAGMRLPVFGAVLAAFLVGAAIDETLPIAVVASVVAWLAALAVDRRGAATAPTVPGPAGA